MHAVDALCRCKNGLELVTKSSGKIYFFLLRRSRPAMQTHQCQMLSRHPATYVTGSIGSIRDSRAARSDCRSIPSLWMRLGDSSLWVVCTFASSPDIFLRSQVRVIIASCRASHEGDWPLHLATAEAMVAYMFAANKYNYSRYVLCYVHSMTWLEPEILDRLCQ